MNYVLSPLLLLVALLLSPRCCAQSTRVLLVGISRYDTKVTRWNPIHGTNDVALLRTVLRNKGITNITELRDHTATSAAIRSSFEQLISQAVSSDVIYVHLSGHGQPVEDYDGDEKGKDAWDEAFVPYDAPRYYRRGTYEGERHLTDDIIHGYIERLRAKVGSHGMVYLSIDACHAGDSYRDDDPIMSDDGEQDGICEQDMEGISQPVWSSCARGSAEGFSKNGRAYSASGVVVREFVSIKPDKRKAPVVVMECCLSTQRSYELKIRLRGHDFYCGPLSYTIYKVLLGGDDKQLRNAGWVKNVKAGFARWLPANNPQKLVIETTERMLCR